MAEPISIQQLKDASEDAITLADFIYKPANVMIPRRLAADINSLQYYLDYMSSYAQHSYETYDEMVANASNLSENVSAFVTNDLDNSKNGFYTYNGVSFVKGDYQPENAAKDYVEAKLGGLQVFDGKVRAQDVSTEDGSTQDVKNAGFRNELDALPFIDGGLAADLVNIGLGLTQKDFNFGVSSVAAMLALPNPLDGVVVNTNSYIAGKNKGGNTYRYNSARAAENDGGSIINGWEVVGKTALTVWDFGYELGNQLGSKTALSKALLSKMPLQLLAETLNAHVGAGAGNDVLAQTITKDKTIFGEGRDVSIIEGLRLQAESLNLIGTGFSINKNGLNHSIFASKYDNIYIDNYSSNGNLDAVLIMGGNTLTAKALVSNCKSTNSSRVGFTSDIAAKNVVFQNCLSYNCRQGFHAEGDFNTTFVDCTADACGDGAMPAIPDYQPPEYAGGFRLHKYNKVTLIRCKNINKNGSNIDQLGGGGNDLTIQDCSGFRLLADAEATELYRNINIKGFKDSSIGLSESSAKLAGDIVIHDFDGGGIELSSNTVDVANSVTSVDLKNIKASRLMLNTHNANAIFTADNVFVRSSYFNDIKGFAHHIIGSLTYSWDNSNTDHYPNLGFRFQSTNAKSFALNTFRSVGANGGSHLALEGMPTTTQVIIGALIGLDTVYSFSNPQELGINNASQYQTRTISLTSELLGNANLDRNKVAKYLGREVYNTTISKFMKATGSTPTSPWISLDGATTITPS